MRTSYSESDRANYKRWKLEEAVALRDLKYAQFRMRMLDNIHQGLFDIQQSYKQAVERIERECSRPAGGGTPRGRGGGGGREEARLIYLGPTPKKVRCNEAGISKGTKRKHDFGERGHRQSSDCERGDEPQSVPIGKRRHRQHEEGSSGGSAVDDTGVALEPRTRTLRPSTEPDSGGVVQHNVLPPSRTQTQDS